MRKGPETSILARQPLRGQHRRQVYARENRCAERTGDECTRERTAVRKAPETSILASEPPCGKDRRRVYSRTKVHVLILFKFNSKPDPVILHFQLHCLRVSFSFC
ncbi:hypothetical protein PoB_004212400 [Plakobranchus ocellatus]|uniref:Uncharacterized protein n=1 Tax=Plakobranchus ocellatus TaxID=259542 RepID=A0AAV4B691_9GAST|nr:hypothetical protein PoB_004212400 [Plakobranchus ocellatus]